MLPLVTLNAESPTTIVIIVHLLRGGHRERNIALVPAVQTTITSLN